jgi:Ca2+-transporting ATPase
MSQVISIDSYRPRRPRPAVEAEPVPAFEVLSALPGRLRLRVPPLHRAGALKDSIECELAASSGVIAVSANTLTATVLIVHAPAQDLALIHVALAGIVRRTAPAQRREPPRPAPATPAQDDLSVRRVRKLMSHAEPQEPYSWHRMSAEAALATVGGSRRGLSVEVAAARLKKYGANVLPEAEPRSALSMFFGQFKSLPVALLGASAVISVATGGLADALVILGVVLINATIGFITEQQAERVIKSLTGPSHPVATVVRDGTVMALAAEQIVPGDLLVLAPGSYVPADARLLEAPRLSIDESALTGESLPVAKDSATLNLDKVPLADRVNMVHMGTQVTGGQGLAVVVATGAATEIGQIQRLVGEAAAPDTPMERQLRTLGNQMVWIAGGVCAGVFVVGLLRGYGVLQMLKSAISLAVAAVPEGLPTVATTTLALGLNQMRRQKVLIRHLDAVETLGSVEVICLDKTGTLTLNRMAVVAALTATERLSVGNGRFHTARGDERNPFEHEELLRLLHAAVLCNETELNGEHGAFRLHGSSTENALVQLALEAGVDVAALRARHPRLRVEYRAENRLYMSTVHAAGDRRLLAVKGSPPEVLALCTRVIRAGQFEPLTDELRQRLLDENAHMAADALRVLAFAYALTDDEGAAEDSLVFLGFAGMADPVRAGVADLIGEFHRAGIETVMITGDQSPTAFAIGRALKLSGNDHLDVLESTHLDALDPQVLAALATRTHVFARVSPAHKLKIVEALQHAGKVVAMTGDGINDGPALKAADVGIAMGHTGTDVARTVADVVLEDDNLETLVVAISQGRTIYNNIRKSVRFLLATNLSEIAVMFGAIGLGLGQPLTPMQLLWLNLVTDIFPALGLALEPPEPDVLRLPPRDPRQPIIGAADFKRLGFEAATLSAGTLAAYGYGVARYGVGPQAGTLAFMTLTGAQLLHAVSARSEHLSVFSRERLPPNRYLTAAVGGSLALQAATLLPGLRGLLGLGAIGIADGAAIAAGAALPFLINEISKPRAARASGVTA